MKLLLKLSKILINKRIIIIFISSLILVIDIISIWLGEILSLNKVLEIINNNNIQEKVK